MAAHAVSMNWQKLTRLKDSKGRVRRGGWLSTRPLWPHTLSVPAIVPKHAWAHAFVGFISKVLAYMEKTHRSQR